MNWNSMKRCPSNPILTRKDIPPVSVNTTDVTSVFNPGAIKIGERYFLLLRVQTRGRETILMVAESESGQEFRVQPRIVNIGGIEKIRQKIYHIYDPRLTQIDDWIYAMFAADTDAGCRLGIARTRDMGEFELVSFGGDTDTRNGVLFPERRDGHFLRLERPNQTRLAGGVASGSEIILSQSPDLITWQPIGPVMAGRFHYWDELLGSGPPPVKTPEGWLHVYHGVATHFSSINIYQAGVVLLDLDDPRRVIARSRNNILEPREPYELTGQVPNVVFPSGMIVEEYDSDGFAKPDSLVRVYYGAADTVVCLATTTINDLLRATRE